LEKRAEQVLPGSKAGVGERKGREEGRNDPNNVCICKYMNKEKNEHL
jgi:hypothetical protein